MERFRRIRAQPCHVALCMVLTLVSQKIRADDLDAIVARGVALRREGHDADALVEFQRALKIQDIPRVRAQVALAEQALGLWMDAETHLLEAMGHANDPWIEKNRVTLTGALDTIQTHLGFLDVWGGPDGAEILVDMKTVGRLPLNRPIRVSGGSVLLVARAKGFMELSRSVLVPPGGKTREHVDLIPVPGPSDVRTGRDQSGDRGQTAIPGLSATSDGAPSTPRLRLAAWGAAAIALGSVVFGIVETKVALDREHAFNDHMAPNPSDPAHPIKDCNTFAEPAECAPLERDYNASVRLAIIGYSVGGALAIGSIVLFVLSSQSDRASTAASASGCGPDVVHRGLICLLAF